MLASVQFRCLLRINACHACSLLIAMLYAAGIAATSGTPSGKRIDAWDVDHASQIAVQPVLLNKQVRTCSLKGRPAPLTLQRRLHSVLSQAAESGLLKGLLWPQLPALSMAAAADRPSTG